MDYRPECCGLIGSIFGHRFEPRYHNESVSSPLSDDSIRIIMGDTPSDEFCSSNLEAAKAQSSKSTYVYDVCERCGQTVKDDIKG